jgi:hypothetical protein
MSALAERHCHVCGVPTDAGFFDDSRIVTAPAMGTEVVLASYQLHPNYCGELLYFAQFTDAFAVDPTEVKTTGLEWEIRCNGNPRDPYVRFDRIINPWGISGFPVHLRLEEGCLTELVVRGTGTTTIATVGGRLLGRFWYNPIYGFPGAGR